MRPDELAAHQLRRLNALAAEILPHNRFYAEKLSGVRWPLESIDRLRVLPYTTKDELLSGEQSPQRAANLTYPPERYVHFHQTSGSHGRPLVVLDTPADWQWWVDTWQFVLDTAELDPSDTVLMAFSFGPFIGFWTAYEAAVERGCLVVPGGGVGTRARLQLIRTAAVTAVFCTPSYALHLAETSAADHMDVAGLPVRKLILAGEPGGSMPSVRRRIEQAWRADVVDHAGATEVGPWGYGNTAGTGLHIVETEFIAEFLDVQTGQPAADGQLAELILTSLGRTGSPVIRYRTGDLVRPRRRTDGSNRFVFLEGGVLGRADDMLIVRGVNVYPTAVEEVLRGFAEVDEYRLTVTKAGEMDHLAIEIEDRLGQPRRVADELQLRLGLKVEVRTAPPGSLPRFEGKGRRLVDQR